jgi:aspartyl aminopeptidase
MAAKKKKLDPADLEISNDNGWTRISARDEKLLESFTTDYRGFLSTVKTEREAHDEGVALAQAKGFKPLQECIDKGTRLKAGDKVYYSAAGKTLFLAHIGKRPITDGMRIVGGHTDSPRLDLKPRPLYEDGNMVLLDTHYYGGVRKYQWVTIPLAMHGVVFKKDGTRVDICIGEDEDDPVLCISDLLPHLAKDQNVKKLGDAITGEGLNVLFGSRPPKKKASGKAIKGAILTLLHDTYGIDESDLIRAELEVVPAGKARDLGIDRSMILGYGHDDRVCAYTGLRATTDLKRTPEYTAMCILCDKEEIGSVGATGMNSFLFENVASEMVNLIVDDYSTLILRRALRASKMLSADVNVLHDPNYPEVSSPNNNMAKMNQGLVVTKYVGARGKSGSNDASAEFMAEVTTILDKAKVVWQTGEIGKVDQGGGGTIAYMMSRYGMDVVDCGPGVLSMHAPWEVASKLDIFMTYKGYSAFLAAK